MKKLRVGMVGMGFIADWHYQGFKANPEAGIVGMCHNFYGDAEQQSKERDELTAKCKEWGIKAYGSFEEIVTDKSIDALIIGSINPLHFDQIMVALDNGKHLLVEKPVVTRFDQLEKVIKKSKEAGKVVFPAHNFVYRSGIQNAKELIKAGKLGKIVYSSFMSSHTISSNHANGWRGKLAISSGGALMDSGHHLVYQSVYLMGMPSKVQAFKSNLVLNQMEGEDIAQINLLYPDGSIGTIMQSWTSGQGQSIDGVKIIGTDSSVAVTEVDYAATFQAQSLAFTEAIAKGTSAMSTLEEAGQTLKLIYAAYESAEKDVVINL